MHEREHACEHTNTYQIGIKCALTYFVSAFSFERGQEEKHICCGIYDCAVDFGECFEWVCGNGN